MDYDRLRNSGLVQAVADLLQKELQLASQRRRRFAAGCAEPPDPRRSYRCPTGRRDSATGSGPVSAGLVMTCSG
jgi:hypothetical protein